MEILIDSVLARVIICTYKVTFSEHRSIKFGMSNSIIRALDLIEILGNADGPLTISEIAELSTLPLSTCHRLLATLAARGYVEQNLEDHRYTLGVAILHMRGAVISQLNLGMIATPAMKWLMQRVNETVHLAVLNTCEIVYIERVEGLHTQGMYTRIGKRAYAHCTALGKVMLAHMPEHVWQEVVDKKGLPRFSPTTITTVEGLVAEMERIRQRGYAVDNGETGENVRCFTAPIRDYTDSVVAAISISGPARQIPTTRDRELSEAVQQAARMISAKLGYQDLSL